MSNKFYSYLRSGLLFYIATIVVIILLFANAEYIPHHWLKVPIYLTIALVVMWVFTIKLINDWTYFESAKKSINTLYYTMVFGIWSVSAIIGTVDSIYGSNKPPPEIAIIILLAIFGIFIFCSVVLLYVLDEVEN